MFGAFMGRSHALRGVWCCIQLSFHGTLDVQAAAYTFWCADSTTSTFKKENAHPEQHKAQMATRVMKEMKETRAMKVMRGMRATKEMREMRVMKGMKVCSSTCAVQLTSKPDTSMHYV